jgi:hypothetical protein
MDDEAQGFVLTLHLAECDDHRVADGVLRDLAHLGAVRGPSAAGDLLFHCTVSARSEAEAVRYVAQRTVGALLGCGVEQPKVLSIEACALDYVAV